MIYTDLNPEKALIWRIIHRDNLAWVLDNGLHCGNSDIKATNWISIGNQELIDKRARHPVPVYPGGVLNDYVPFYFTPFSAMMKNILSGRNGVRRRGNEEILILVSSIWRIQELELPFLFTDAHAYYRMTRFYSDPANLDKIDWNILQHRDFKRDNEDLAKFERYQAEALVYKYLPIQGLKGIVCYTDEMKQLVEQKVRARNLDLAVHVRKGLYFQ